MCRSTGQDMGYPMVSRGELGEVEMVPKPTLIRAVEMYNFRHAK